MLSIVAWALAQCNVCIDHQKPKFTETPIILIIKIGFKIASFSVNLGFSGSIQTLQCARAQATMLGIQCFSLESFLDSSSWADFEDCQLDSPLTYRVI